MKKHLQEVKKLIHLSDIPSDIKEKLKLLGRGVTSIVFDKGDDKVLLITMDPMKTKWLTYSGLGKYIKSMSLNGKNLDFLEVEKLKSLSRDNLKIVRKFIKEFRKNHMSKIYSKLKDTNTGNFWFLNVPKHVNLEAMHEALLELSDEFKKHFRVISKEKDMISFLANWLLNHGEDILVDFHSKNFMEDEDKKIVIIDPIIQEEYMDLIFK